MESPGARTYEGRCHCGAVGFAFTTALAPKDWSVRCCQCAFCRAHGARCTSDPRGRARIVVARAEHLVRYRFALETADFLVCSGCGVYVAAMIATPRGRFAIVNLNALAADPAGLAPSAPASYDGETLGARVARREERWTPVVE